MEHRELLDTAHKLRTLIESEADAIERDATMSEAVVEAIHGAGLFRLMAPRDLGGLEADPETIIDVSEAISYADGSVGWAYCQNCSVMAFSAYVDAEFGREIVAARAAAGMFAPLGVAEKQADGYQISGSYLFGSGSGHADHIGGAALVMENGEMIMDGELPVMISFIVPADGVKLNGNWDVMGLCGTGSYDFEVTPQFVPESHTYPLFTRSPVTGGALYRIGGIPLATINSVGWALGVASRALDEITAIAKNGRARLGVLPLREQQIFQRDLGLHSTAVDGARHLAKNVYASAVEQLATDLPEEDAVRVLRKTKAAANYVAKIAKEATTFAWEASGSAGMRNPSRVQRCFRDICMGAGHQVFDDRNYIELVKESLGLAPDPF